MENGICFGLIRVDAVDTLTRDKGMPRFLFKCERCGRYRSFLTHEAETLAQKTCPTCHTTTSWAMKGPDRRSGRDRRAGAKRRTP